MRKLVGQIVKFGVVGVICFFIDYLIGLAAVNLILRFRLFGESSFIIGSQIGAALGFAVSVVVNYILSFKFVFARREEMDRRAEFIIFLVLSVIGLGINQLIIGIATGPLYSGVRWLRETLGYSMMYTGAKILATAVVMVYNFVTRKIFLEQKKAAQ
ncbi:GtrA family protein [Lachnoclostridium sp. Marseille-P6806]|uniref:GtrA family protein n=1 Tax=Lachnoclostridium sp. Marseille-P6806 TaxID=2364793 RepID=UPI001031EBE9|nr:GtrA family protein [Lachnoclostridium sp. Marseille-P6806]